MADQMSTANREALIAQIRDQEMKKAELEAKIDGHIRHIKQKHEEDKIEKEHLAEDDKFYQKAMKELEVMRAQIMRGFGRNKPLTKEWFEQNIEQQEQQFLELLKQNGMETENNAGDDMHNDDEVMENDI